MRILTVNPGSHSLELHVVETRRHRIVAEWKAGTRPDQDTAREKLRAMLEYRPRAVAQRLVHGGPSLRAPTLVSREALDAVEAAADLAPQHVPPTLAMVAAVRELAPDLGQVLCPDTAFHADLPEPAATYAVPTQWRQRYSLRRYGFHGLSCSWALRAAAEQLRRPATQLRLVIAHLGGGCSATAVDRGRSVDTSMGFTPMEGLAMSTRAGTLDPGMLLWLIEHAGLSAAHVREQLSAESGLLGLSNGFSGDTRDLVAAAAEGGEKREVARFALKVFCHRARREIAAVAASLPTLDALVFTGEIGGDQPEVRNEISRGLGILGEFRELVVQPAEHLEMAHQAAHILTNER